MIFRFFISLLVLSFLPISQVGYGAKPYSLQQLHSITGLDQTEGRPFRLGLLRFNEVLDRSKPLAAADYGGWVVADDLLVGAVDNKWLAGFSLPDLRAQWWAQLPSQLSIPPMVVGSWLIVATLDGTLAKYEAQTGQKLWEIQLESALLRMPISQGNDLIAFTSGQTLYSVGFQDGKVNWLTATEYPKNLIVRSLAAPVIYEGNIFLGVNSGEIIVFDANTGAQGKKIDVGISSGRFRDFTGSMLAISGKLYYSRYDGLMGSYDVSSSGKESGEVWQQQITDIATSAVRNGIFYIGCVNGDVYAYRLTDGKRLWRTATGSSVRQLTVGEHQIYLGSATGRIVAMNIKDGDILWHDHLRNAITSPPVYINGDLFFSTGYKNLYGYKLQFSDTNPL